MSILIEVASALRDSILDLFPVVLVVAALHMLSRQSRSVFSRSIVVGLLYVLAGLTLFRIGADMSLLPVGSGIADNLARLPSQIHGPGEAPPLHAYIWLYLFCISVGFSMTLVEPALVTMAQRIHELSGGLIGQLTFRVVVALGVSFGLAAGSVGLVWGIPLEYVITALIAIIALLTGVTPPAVRAAAFDCGGAATSVLVAPFLVVTSVGIATALPTEDGAASGFGLVMLALLSPIATALMYFTISTRLRS